MILLHARVGEPNSKWCCGCFILTGDWTKSVALHRDNMCPDCLGTFSNVWTHFLFSHLELFIYYVNNFCLYSQCGCWAWSSLPMLLKVWSWATVPAPPGTSLEIGTAHPSPRLAQAAPAGSGLGVFSAALWAILLSGWQSRLWVVLFQSHKCHCYLSLRGNSGCFWPARILRCWSPCALTIKYFKFLYDVYITHTFGGLGCQFIMKSWELVCSGAGELFDTGSSFSVITWDSLQSVDQEWVEWDSLSPACGLECVSTWAGLAFLVSLLVHPESSPEDGPASPRASAPQAGSSVFTVSVGFAPFLRGSWGFVKSSCTLPFWCRYFNLVILLFKNVQFTYNIILVLGYNIVTRHLYTLWSDHSDKWRTHLTAHMVITISLTIFLTLYITYPWL